MRIRSSLILAAIAFSVLPIVPPARAAVSSGSPVRVVIVGLEHEHAEGLLQALPKNSHVVLVGIADGDKALAERYAAQFHLDPKLFYTNAETMVTQQKPDAVLVYTNILDHRAVIEMAAHHGVSSMVEKPLATTLTDALAIRRAAREYHVHVLVNYETTWHASDAEILRDVKQDKLGELRRVVFYTGNKGPKDMHVGPEFLSWLTDPLKNGAGALFDFGCYGADLMTALMNGKAPLSVTAVTLTADPRAYPNLDDSATIVLRYPTTQAVLQPSWNWTFARKDMEAYGTKGYEVTVGDDNVGERFVGDPEETQITASPLVGPQRNALDYLAGVLHGEVSEKGDLSSLDTNVVVVQILDAARESARTGRTIRLSPLPN